MNEPFLPLDVVFHPNWWNRHYGLSFDWDSTTLNVESGKSSVCANCFTIVSVIWVWVKKMRPDVLSSVPF